jgi:hypothetical protein
MNEIKWEQTDSPAAAELAAVANGLELSNQAAADLSAVPQLYFSVGFEVACEFRGFPDGAIMYVLRKVLSGGQ